MKTADGFDDAIAGIIRQFNQPAKVVYDYGKCLEILEKRDGMTHDEAIEFMEFNVVGAYVGEDTPAWMMQPTSSANVSQCSSSRPNLGSAKSPWSTYPRAPCRHARTGNRK